MTGVPICQTLSDSIQRGIHLQQALLSAMLEMSGPRDRRDGPRTRKDELTTIRTAEVREGRRAPCGWLRGTALVAMLAMVMLVHAWGGATRRGSLERKLVQERRAEHFYLFRARLSITIVRRFDGRYNIDFHSRAYFIRTSLHTSSIVRFFQRLATIHNTQRCQGSSWRLSRSWNNGMFLKRTGLGLSLRFRSLPASYPEAWRFRDMGLRYGCFTMKQGKKTYLNNA